MSQETGDGDGAGTPSSDVMAPSLMYLSLKSLTEEIQWSLAAFGKPPPKYQSLQFYELLKGLKTGPSDHDVDAKIYLADILSGLAMTMSEEGQMESLKYKILSSKLKNYPDGEGHEYIRNLAAEIQQEFKSGKYDKNDLEYLVEQIVSFFMTHNAEPEAVDLLLKVKDFQLLVEDVDLVYSSNFKRTCLYLTNIARSLPKSEGVDALILVYDVYKETKYFANAFLVALSLESIEHLKEVFKLCDNVQEKQFCYILARHGITQFEVYDEFDEVEVFDSRYMLNNLNLSESYLTLAGAIDIMEPKSPGEIYKAHLLDGRAGTCVSIDSDRENLASTFFNAFVNAGFGKDKLMIVPSDSGDSSGNWISKNKEHGKTSAVASLGLILLWDVNAMRAQIKKYSPRAIYDNHLAAGLLLGFGIANCGGNHKKKAVLNLMSDFINRQDSSTRIAAIMGLGIAYAGIRADMKHQIFNNFSGILGDPTTPIDMIAFTAISLGLVYVGSCKINIARAIISVLENRQSELEEHNTRFLCLAIGLLYLGKKKIPTLTEFVKEKTRKKFYVSLLSCAYAGTGNVLKVQELLSYCAEHVEKGDTHQGPAVLGIALVTIAEESGLERYIHSLKQLLQSGEQNVRRAVPLALGLLRISNPKVDVMDTLSILSRDSDSEVAMAAVISLGLIGAGTNDSRIAGILCYLSKYYNRDDCLLFCVRIAQGLVHLGKGLLTLNPFHSDRLLLSPVGLAGLVTMLHACLDMNATILGNYHYILYFLVLAMQPRMLMTLDRNLNPLSVPVRVGQAVDSPVAGLPKSIYDIQIHHTPVLLAAGQRAELHTDKYIPLSPNLEGHVILIENPEYRGP